MLVITQGDPAGVGPELLLRLAADGQLRPEDRVVAGRRTLRMVAETLDLPWAHAGLAAIEPLLDPVIQAREAPGAPLGQFLALERGVDLVLEHAPSAAATAANPGPALVTAPIDKAVASAEGLRHPGHTEYLAERAGVEDFAMLMAGPQIRVVLATIHVPLRRVAELLDTSSVVRAGRLLARTLAEDFAIAAPRVGILGLNPHAGEGGLLGSEEQRVIEPAVAALQHWATEIYPSDQRPRFHGPLSADTAFHHHQSGSLDGLVAMYHDQGLGPFKLAHFHDGVNVTLGLPFVRTSPDHGTAKDIAGRGVAHPTSMQAAVDMARAMLRSRMSAAPTPRS
ncbi:4-hydroxythreonine-4-phosphate dehydrogenase PdxA [Pseudenhygromyxa sp. WMMC2535]|uniref:4-hydroxythreonine-4-phosphate dehydrogenase PdxA n=1 Tax=Pseudenhygromyxa sp. WMMC2535 TaxID=2712867 RepID=UPI001551AB7F|nr:4-hydroxythreonine-4-phosphate dehydrogenase PdxA [Pseudenhygromyxa sp. WMMC2535]NVB40236.1 4-hydroxythreonine-4-phosphate dehydrogenase PdxA [Pseudenhygromyxa sp. WMMC2535]